MGQVLKFDVRRRALAFELEGEGGVRKYEVRELLGVDRDAYMAELAALVKIGPDGKPTGISASRSSLQISLLARSVFDVTGLKPTLVPVDQLGAWPARVVDFLADKVNDLSALTPEEETAVGNASKASGSSGSASPTG